MAKTNIGLFQETTKRMLIKHPNLRDDVGLLYVAVIGDLKGMDYIKNTSLYDHFKYGKNDIDKLPSISSIVRLSTKIQKENEELRGEHWVERQKHSKDYQEDLGYGKAR